MPETGFRCFLQVVVDGELHAAPFARRNLFERADLASDAVDHHAPGAVLSHQDLVVDTFDTLLSDDGTLHDAVTKLRFARLTDIAEQVRSERVGGVLARRHFFHDDVGKLEVQPPRGDRRHLRQRRILDHHDRAIRRLAAMTLDGLQHLLQIEARDLREQARRAIEVLGVFAEDRNGERVPILDEDLPVAIEQHAARRAQSERPLVVVLRHLLVLVVLNDLEDPETDPERGEHHDHGELEHHQPLTDSPAIFTLRHLIPAL